TAVGGSRFETTACCHAHAKQTGMPLTRKALIRQAQIQSSLITPQRKHRLPQSLLAVHNSVDCDNTDSIRCLQQQVRRRSFPPPPTPPTSQSIPIRPWSRGSRTSFN